MKGIANKHQKELITCTVAVHYIQARVYRLFKEGKVDMLQETLRSLGKRIKIEGEREIAAQEISHALTSLVKLGALQMINGIVVYKDNSTPN